MTVQRPMQVAPLAREHRAQVVDWLNNPAVAPMLDVEPPIGMTHIVQRQLPVRDRDGVLAMEPVFFYGITDATGALHGVSISYAWDDDEPDIRECDFVVPGLGNAWRAVNEIIVRIAHAVFTTEHARELRVFLRHGKTGDGHVRIFTRFGCNVVPYDERANLRGTLFSLTPDAYYASEPVRRLGFRKP